MLIVRMDLDAAFTLAAALQHDGRGLAQVDGDIHNDIASAHDLLHSSSPGPHSPMASLADIGDRLQAMSVDLEWRVRLLAATDRASAERLGAVTGHLPHRSLHLIMASPADLVAQVVNGSYGERASAIHEVEFRSADDPGFAADFVRSIGSTNLVSTWADIATTPAGGSTALSLARIQVYAMASADQEAITVVSEVATGLHFLEENRMLAKLRRHFATLDTAADGGESDGEVSYRDLLEASSETGALAAAASWVINNLNVFQFLTVGSDRHDYLDRDATLTWSHALDARTLTIDEIDEYQHMRDAAFAVWPLLPLIDVAVQHEPGSADGFLSRRDFEVALSWPGLTEYQRSAMRRILADGAFDSVSKWKNALTAAGWIPLVGDAVDATAMLHYLSHGEWEDASFYAIGLMPLPGFSGSNVRVAREMVERHITDGLRGAVEVGARDFAHRAGEWEARTSARSALTGAAAQRHLPSILNNGGN